MNNINKLLSLNEDFNFNDFSKKISNKDIVRIIKENNEKNYIILRVYKESKLNDLFNFDLENHSFSKRIYKMECNNEIISDDSIFYPEIDIRLYLNTKNLTNLSNMFYNKRNITYIDFSNLFLDKITDISSLFAYCENLKEVKFGKHFNTKSVINMANLFSSCYSLVNVDLENLNVENVENTNSMFLLARNIKDINKIEQLHFNNLRDIQAMFDGCRALFSINLNNFNFTNINEMDHLFDSCINLKKVNFGDHFNIPNVKSLSNLFNECNNLEQVNIKCLNSNKLKDISFMFSDCINLETLDLSSFNFNYVFNINYMFYKCKKLKELHLNSSLKNDIFGKTHIYKYANPNVEKVFNSISIYQNNM